MRKGLYNAFAGDPIDMMGFPLENLDIPGTGLEPAHVILRMEGRKSPNNPVIVRGAPGSWSFASVRDPSQAWYARGKYWIHYTGWRQITAPFFLRLGIASAVDPVNGPWTDHGQVVDVNATPGQPDSGLVASTDIYYDSATDELWTFATWSVLPEEAYTGPLSIGLYKCAAGADWTNPASYIKQHGGASILTRTLTWEGNQGVYAPSVVKIGDLFVMYYSTSNAPGNYRIGYATSPTLGGTWTKHTDFIVSELEEPNVMPLPDGGYIMVGDPYAQGIPGTGVRTSADGFTNWKVEENLFASDQSEWDADTMGSASISRIIGEPRKALLLYGGGTVAGGANGEARDIGAALVTFGEVA